MEDKVGLGRSENSADSFINKTIGKKKKKQLERQNQKTCPRTGWGREASSLCSLMGIFDLKSGAVGMWCRLIVVQDELRCFFHGN